MRNRFISLLVLEWRVGLGYVNRMTIIFDFNRELVTYILENA